jgi:hypothetical protein
LSSLKSSSIVDDPEMKSAISELQAEADRLQIDDPEYRAEQGHRIGNGALGSFWLASVRPSSRISTSVIEKRNRTRNWFGAHRSSPY